MPEPEDGAKAANPRKSESVGAIWPADPMAGRRVQLSEAADMVRHAWADLDPQDGAERRDARGRPEGVSRPIGRERDLAILLAERDAAAHPADLEVRVPRHLSASGVVSFADDPQAFARDLRRPMPSPPALAARRGTAFHAWVEQHFSQAAFVDVMDLPGSADEHPAGDQELPLMKERFLASEWSCRTPEAIEIAIETTVAGMAIRGRIDAVFPRAGGGFTVVDWKTGVRPTGEKARVRAVQLGAYCLAFARLRGLARDQVDGAFYYAGTGETVFPDLPGEAQLVALMASIPT